MPALAAALSAIWVAIVCPPCCSPLVTYLARLTADGTWLRERWRRCRGTGSVWVLRLEPSMKHWVRPLQVSRPERRVLWGSCSELLLCRRTIGRVQCRRSSHSNTPPRGQISCIPWSVSPVQQYFIYQLLMNTPCTGKIYDVNYTERSRCVFWRLKGKGIAAFVHRSPTTGWIFNPRTVELILLRGRGGVEEEEPGECKSTPP